MAHLIGETAVDRFTIMDAEGNLVAGATFTVDASYAPDATPIESTTAELGGGAYEVTWPFTISGGYYLRQFTTDTVPPQYHESQLRTDDPLEGETVSDYFTIVDVTGAYVTGATVTVDASYDPAGLAFVPTISDLGNGLYRSDWVAGFAGVYTLRLRAVLPSVIAEPQYFEFETRVGVTPPAAASPFTTPLGSSLDDLIRDVALLCRDYYEVFATSDAQDGASFPDDLSLAARSPKMFMGSSLFVVAAANAENVGREVRVRDSVNGALVLTPPLPGAIRQGDRAYLTNLESAGFARQTYRSQINSRIRTVFPNALQPARWTFGVDDETLFDATAPYLTPPGEFTHLTSVGYASAAYDVPTDYIPMAETDDYRAGWYWDAGNDRIVIQGGYQGRINSQAVSISGYGRWGQLDDDNDTTGIDAQWIGEMTAGLMILSLRDARRISEAMAHINRADSYMLKMVTQLRPYTIQIRG